MEMDLCQEVVLIVGYVFPPAMDTSVIVIGSFGLVSFGVRLHACLDGSVHACLDGSMHALTNVVCEVEAVMPVCMDVGVVCESEQHIFNA